MVVTDAIVTFLGRSKPIFHGKIHRCCWKLIRFLQLDSSRRSIYHYFECGFFLPRIYSLDQQGYPSQQWPGLIYTFLAGKEVCSPVNLGFHCSQNHTFVMMCFLRHYSYSTMKYWIIASFSIPKYRNLTVGKPCYDWGTFRIILIHTTKSVIK